MSLDWTDKINGRDTIDASDVNALAAAIIENEAEVADLQNAVDNLPINGIEEAAIGDLVRIAEVDGSGKPTAFEPYAPEYENGREYKTGETYKGYPVYIRFEKLPTITTIGLNSKSIDGSEIIDILSVSGFLESEGGSSKISLPFFAMRANGDVLSDVRISSQIVTTGSERKLRFNVVLAADNNGTIIGFSDRPTAIVRYTKIT